MSPELYADHFGDMCPVCESRNLEAEPFHGDSMGRPCTCRECGSYWFETMQVTGYTELKTPDQDE